MRRSIGDLVSVLDRKAVGLPAEVGTLPAVAGVAAANDAGSPLA